MTKQDVILKREKIVKIVSGAKSYNCLMEDDNCQLLLQFLLKGPMTFDDIKQSFDNVDASKSDKTIYGYLNKLKKAGLVMEAGKRIITVNDSPVKTLTLYSRVAKAFYIDIKTGKKDGLTDDYLKVIASLTKQILNKESIQEDKFNNLINKVASYRKQTIEAINDLEDIAILDELSQFNVRGTKYILDIISWLSYLGNNEKFVSELLACFK
jgi:DNA-binding PadR family transcriptional regulator